LAGIGDIPNAALIEELCAALADHGVSSFSYGDLRIEFHGVEEEEEAPKFSTPSNPRQLLDMAAAERRQKLQPDPEEHADFRQNPALWPDGKPPEYVSPYSRANSDTSKDDS